MRRSGYYKQDWFIALLVGIVFGVAILFRSSFLERVELIAYDIGVNATHRAPGAADQIAIVAIDDASIAEIGRWPWPRSAYTEVLERLAKAEPRAVAVLLDLTEARVDPGLTSIREIREKLSQMAVPRQASSEFAELRALLNQAEKDLDADRALAQALRKTPNLHLPMFPDVGGTPRHPAAKIPDYMERHRLANATGSATDSNWPYPIAGLRVPLEQFGRYASGVGHLSVRIDADNGVRAIRPVLQYDGQYYPALPLLLAARSFGLDVRHIEYEIDKGIKLGKLFVPTDLAAQTYIGFYQPLPGKEHAFAIYSFRDVQQDKLPPSAFTNKIVLIGPAATGAGATYATPVTTTNGAPISEPELVANVTASILNEDFYTTPDWTAWAQPAIALMVLLYMMLALARMRGKTALLVSLLVLVGLLGAEQFLMVTQKVWLQATSPALLLLVGYLAIVIKRFVLGERERAETDSMQSDRMLGLSLQSQGQLDMALDKFRALPVDESVLDLIYNLALDFERKRQFHKAAAAYDYILDHRRNFRDCVERKKRASQGDQTLAFGKTLILDGAERPTLGRYRIEKEIGRGEMGIVYLGRDPKINRRVAIKTMALSPEMGVKDLGNVRERFFREAETAGRLHHPNIVTIYDVGEEHDLAYIAMEYLEGKELSTYIEPGKPLPFDWILDVAIKIADALAYAHRNDVVHRDIKPHNIFYHEATGGVKVMDFGIARITAANRTKTGLVLGTPAYMSPEQISGKRVDGRSDQFSFGCMLFELVTGDTPFGGDTFAALTHQVINAPTPDIRKLRPDTPMRLVAIIKRLLQKQVTKRFQSGDEMKEALEQCRGGLNEAAKA
jgi:CHASE2 domain-containing sensor protein